MKTTEEFENMNRTPAQLSENELEYVTGGREEYTIPRPVSPEFWRSWNPNASEIPADSAVIRFSDSDDYIDKCTFE